MWSPTNGLAFAIKRLKRRRQGTAKESKGFRWGEKKMRQMVREIRFKGDGQDP